MNKEKKKKEDNDNDEEISGLLKRLLLKLIKNDKDIQGAISSLPSKEQENSQVVKEKEKEINRLLGDIEKQNKNYSILESHYENEKNKNKSIEKQLEDEKIKNKNIEKQLEEEKNKRINTANELKKSAEEKDLLEKEKKQTLAAMEEIKKRYDFMAELDKVYNTYNTLPSNLKKSMDGFIRGDSLINFLMSGARDSNMEIFWEYCKIEVQKNNGLQYSGEITEIFVFFFLKINSATDSPLYKIFEPAANSKFDDASMILSNSSLSRDGFVDKTVFPGYSGVNTGNIIKKAIVTLKG